MLPFRKCWKSYGDAFLNGKNRFKNVYTDVFHQLRSVTLSEVTVALANADDFLLFLFRWFFVFQKKTWAPFRIYK